MLEFNDSARQTIHLSPTPQTTDLAREEQKEISRIVDAPSPDEARRGYWEKWSGENKDAIDAYDKRIADEGLPLARYRSFAPSLGDGSRPGSSSTSRMP